jgi:phosphoglycolate phosphatase
MAEPALSIKGIPSFYPNKLPKAILFDWDNTLVDTWRVAYHALNVALTASGKKAMTTQQFWAEPHLSMKDAARDLFGDFFEEGEKLFYEEVDKIHLQELLVLDGAETLLNKLKTHGIYAGVVSNKEGSRLRREVDHLGWTHHFHRVVGSRDAEEDKPSRLAVLAALHPSTIAPSHDVWFVGDSIVDVRCARASGCVPVVVGQGEASQQDDIVHVNNCAGLMQLLSELPY